MSDNNPKIIGNGVWIDPRVQFGENVTIGHGSCIGYPDEDESELKIMDNVIKICREAELTICGGHTEITDSVIRPVVSCTIAGTVEKEQLINKKNILPDDSIILTKRGALEGTSILANDFSDILSESGFTPEFLKKSQKFIDKISIVKEAEIAVETGSITALHDVTEGGVSTSIEELSSLCGYGFDIDMDKILFYDETLEICSYFNINPFGLIGSGSLIICCRKMITDKLLFNLNKAGIEAVKIGSVSNRKPGIKTMSNEPWPIFDTDEITKVVN